MIQRDIEMEARWFYWLCGLMEGEGTFTKATPSMPRKPRLSIGMTDRDVIERVLGLTGTRLCTHEWPNQRYQTVYRTEVVGGSAVALMQLLRPEMGQRRQTQIDAAIATFQPLRRIRHKTYSIVPVGADECERYWLAGFLEGEASFSWSELIKAPRLELYNTDHDVVERVRQIWHTRYGIDTFVRARSPRKAGYKPQYQLLVYGVSARLIMADLAPLLGERRRARVGELLEAPRGLREAGLWYDPRVAA